MNPTTPARAGDQPVARAVLYLRVSTKRQMDTDYDVDPDGNSIATQRAVCQAKARQMGVVVAADSEYVEPGNSAQSIEKRPVFRQMLGRIIERRDVEYVIVYMFSRAFRNRLDEAITKNTLQKLGVKIMSAKENFGEGPMADAMEGVVAVFNELQVRMNGEDIKTKMANKAKNGGTPGWARLGYINTTTTIDGRKINTVIVDEKRRQHIVMAFELFATGHYTLDTARDKLSAAGLRTRATGRWPSGTISRHKLGEMLRDRYYIGYVPYKGMEYPGRHEPLISEELFDRVQRVLDAHQGSGVRQRTHHHYLKGLVWCHRCGQRFVVQRATGRRGGEYFYFFCRGRQDGTCDQPYVPVEVMEEAIADHYRSSVRVSDEFRAEVRTLVDDTVAANTGLTKTVREQYTKRLELLNKKESYLLDLAAEEGWPKEQLRDKIAAIRTERTNIQHSLTTTKQQLDTGRAVFYAALDLLDDLATMYRRGNETVRTTLNTALFTRLHVEGHKVAGHQLREPFDVLESAYRTYHRTGSRPRPHRSHGSNSATAPSATRPVLGQVAVGSNGLSRTDRLELAFAAGGSSKTILADLVRAYSKRHDLMDDLNQAVRRLARATAADSLREPLSVRSTGRVKRVRVLPARLPDGDSISVLGEQDGSLTCWTRPTTYVTWSPTTRRSTRTVTTWQLGGVTCPAAQWRRVSPMSLSSWL